ncbi:hypothetical protein BS78_09G033500 [Paspalum vaginatum]|nr:hypothetical protein BS78_09G033500 [Paspalum vaginatum]
MWTRSGCPAAPATLSKPCQLPPLLATRIDLSRNALGGCSDVAIAVSRMPTILGMSEERLLAKIQFLLNKVGLEPKYILERPTLLGFSLEKWLVPRHCVMKLLQAKRLLNSDLSFYTLPASGERTFRLKFVDCHMDSVPGLTDAYTAATIGGMPLGIPSLTSL